MGADIALFPEMWSDGYYLPQEDGAADKLTIAVDSEMDMLRDYREHKVMEEKYRHPDKYGLLTKEGINEATIFI